MRAVQKAIQKEKLDNLQKPHYLYKIKKVYINSEGQAVMESIGIGDIQKNTAILSNLTESLEIVDKRRKRTVAIVYPVKKTNITAKLAGKYAKKVNHPVLSIKQLNQATEKVMLEAMEEKYGRTD